MKIPKVNIKKISDKNIADSPFSYAPFFQNSYVFLYAGFVYKDNVKKVRTITSESFKFFNHFSIISFTEGKYALLNVIYFFDISNHRSLRSNGSNLSI